MGGHRWKRYPKRTDYTPRAKVKPELDALKPLSAKHAARNWDSNSGKHRLSEQKYLNEVVPGTGYDFMTHGADRVADRLGYDRDVTRGIFEFIVEMLIESGAQGHELDFSPIGKVYLRSTKRRWFFRSDRYWRTWFNHIENERLILAGRAVKHSIPKRSSSYIRLYARGTDGELYVTHVLPPVRPYYIHAGTGRPTPIAPVRPVVDPPDPTGAAPFAGRLRRDTPPYRPRGKGVVGGKGIPTAARRAAIRAREQGVIIDPEAAGVQPPEGGDGRADSGASAGGAGAAEPG